MSDSSVLDDPGGPGGGQEAADTTWSSIESMPPWAGLPAEQYALSTGSARPGEACSVVAALQWPAAGRLPHPGHSTGGLLSARSSRQVAGAVHSPPVLTPGAAAQQPAHWPSLRSPGSPAALNSHQVAFGHASAGQLP